MFCCSLYSSTCIISKRQCPHRCSPLPIHMCRRERNRQICKQFFCDSFFEYRYAISKERNFFSITSKLFCQFFYADRHLIFYDPKFSNCIKPIDSGIDLSSSRIHDRTYKPFCSIQIISQSLQRRNMNQRFFQRQPKPLRGCRSDSESGK